MPFLLATDWHALGQAAECTQSLAAPLLHDGAVETHAVDLNTAHLRCLRWPGIARPAECATAPNFVLVIEGYTISPTRSADELAQLYRTGGIEALQQLDGSFVIAILDAEKRTAVVLTDRAGSRPIFYSHNDAGLLIAPELKCFRASCAGESPRPAALLSLLINSYMFGEMTYWPSVRCLGPARRLTLRGKSLDIARYWTPAFGQTAALDPKSCDEIIVHSVSEHLGRFERPVIGLSGGVDSRVMIAAIQAAGMNVPTLTWTYSEQDNAESDLAVAARVAEKAGFPHEQFRLNWKTLAEDASALVHASDGLIGHLGGFADRHRFAANISTGHDAIFLGDQCYRGESEVHSPDEAVEAIGISTLPAGVRRLIKFFMRPEAAETATADYTTALRELQTSDNAGLSPQDLHDRLYWQVRLPRLLTGPKALWRRYLDAVSPLLSAPMLNLAAALPPDQRVHKRFLRDAVARLDPDLAAIPYATRSGRVKWRRVMKDAGAFQRYLVDTLVAPQPAFDRWFDRKSIELACRAVFAEAPSTAPDGSDGLFAALTRRARGLMVRPYLRPPVLLGLLTLKLWLAEHSRPD